MNNELTKQTKRVQRTFAYRGWTIQCDRSGLIWDIKPEGGFYDGCYKSKAAAELAVDQGIVAAAEAKAAAEARGDFGADDFGVPYRSAQHAAYDRAQKKGGSK
jgi:hypothetical protein